MIATAANDALPYLEDAAALVALLGGFYAFGRWLRHGLTHVIDERNEPIVQGLDDLRQELRDHMYSEEEQAQEAKEWRGKVEMSLHNLEQIHAPHTPTEGVE